MKPVYTEREIDERVTAEAEDDTAWDEPVFVHRQETIALPLSETLVTRARFLATLHRENEVEKWLEQIIRERVELEESIFARVRRELATSAG